MTETKTITITVSNKDLQTALKKVKGAVSSKQAMSILANVLIEVYNGDMQIKASDLELSVITKIHCENDDSTSFTVHADKLETIIKTFPLNSILEFNLNENILTLKDKDKKIKAKHKLQTLSAEDYPEFPQIEKEKTIEIDGNVLKEGLSQVMYSVSNEESRHFLKSVFFTNYQDELIFATTDGKRLARYKTNVSVVDEIEAIIPLKTASELLHITQNDEKVKLSFTDAKVFAETKNDVIISSLIQSTFPNIDKVIPDNLSVRAETETNKIKEVLERVSALLDKNNVRIKTLFKEGKIIFDAENPDYGESSDEIFVEYNDKDKIIGFNAYYLFDAVKHISEKELCISWDDNALPVQINGKNNTKSIHIVMPMRLENE